MRKVSISGIALLLVVVSYAVSLLVEAGGFKTITPHFNGTCKSLGGIPGPEDVEFSRREGLLFISSDDRPEESGPNAKQVKPSGAIYAWDLKQAQSIPILVSGKLEFEFHPHGMAIWDRPEGPRLWVINHRTVGSLGSPETTIEIFDYLSGHLNHLKTLSDPLLLNSNDLAAINETQFYTTHDHSGHTELANKFEDYSRIGRGYVTFFDGKSFSVKARGIRFANGIVAIPGSQQILVASMTGKTVQVYRRDPENHGDLSFEHEISLGTAPDNLSLNENGELWIGAHPILLKLSQQSKDHSRLAPAQALVIRKPLDDHPQVEEIFLNGGELQSAASVAFNLGNRLILGSVFSSHLLDCEITAKNRE